MIRFKGVGVVIPIFPQEGSLARFYPQGGGARLPNSQREAPENGVDSAVFENFGGFLKNLFLQMK